MNITLELTSPAAPLQIEGTVDDTKIYFRERHDSWRFEVDDIVIAVGDERVTVEDAIAIIIDKTMIGQRLFDEFRASSREDA